MQAPARTTERLDSVNNILNNGLGHARSAAASIAYTHMLTYARQSADRGTVGPIAPEYRVPDTGYDWEGDERVVSSYTR
ncbi:hypothetical protein C8Q73DRAFT_537654 [Cubamyces lactineus]|nr:hypothetical protein C8Q73DRAFT_537654 [Cubamyces lactineus]